MLEIKVPTNCLATDLGLEILKLIQKMFRFAKEPICRYMSHSGLENDLETGGQCSQNVGVTLPGFCLQVLQASTFMG